MTKIIVNSGLQSIKNEYKYILQDYLTNIEKLKEEENKILKEQNKVLTDKILELSRLIGNPVLMTTSGTGEWCSACGAWKQYGQSDNHHCTGYKVTC